MLKCGDATQTPDDAEFRSCISDWLDVGEWLRVIAAETIMPELESFIGYYRNIYLYFKPDPAMPNGGKFVVWPWDLDQSFHKQSCYPSCTATSQNVLTSVSSFYGPAGTRAPLVQRLTTVFREEYCAALTEFATVAMKPATIDTWVSVMEPGMLDEPNHTPEEWQAAVSVLRTWVEQRAAAVPTMIQSACQ
jgi:spore coat protein CotH